jgi:hypothetical protein
MVGIPLLPPFADITEQNIDISKGVNFASASAGILNETGRNLVISVLTIVCIYWNFFILCVFIN